VTTTVTRTFDRGPRALVEGQQSEEYLRDRSAALGGTDPATVSREGGVVTVRFPRRLPLDSLPGPLRSLAGSGDVTQVETWTEISDERCTATWRTDSSMPGKVTGTFEVTPTGDGGATYTVTATADVKVPLIGGRITKEVEAQVRKLIEAEMDFATKWLASH
jgi:hypothetical protein